MAVRIRLRRVGKVKHPSYRVVAADSRAQRGGEYIELLGFYDPRSDPPKVELRMDRINDWLNKGASPSDRVKVLIAKHNTNKE